MSVELIVESKQTITDKVSEFVLASANGERLPTYTAGAHLQLELGEVGSRAYSLVDWQAIESAPKQYRVAVQREDQGTGGSLAMHALKKGDTVTAGDPKNSFELDDSDGPVLLFAGGIGITPMISFATELERRGTPFQFHYAARDPQVGAFVEQLKQRFPQQLQLWFDNANPVNIPALLEDLDPFTHVYCCGPKGMIDAVRRAAEAAGMPGKQVHFELFAAPKAQADDKAFEVQVIGSDEIYTVPADKSIVQVLNEAGHDVMHDCDRGDCGSCQVKVVSGEVDHRDVVLSEAQREAGDVMQMCVSRAKSERLVLDLKADTKPKRKKRKPCKPRLIATSNSGGRYTNNPDAVSALVEPGQVHRDAYIDQEVYELEMRHLFTDTWVYVGHDSITPNKGDYFTTQIGDQPVIMVRHQDDQMYVVHNRCPHKGVKIVNDRTGHTGKFFRCPYHAWTFKTDGCLLSVPLAKGYANTAFDQSEAAEGLQPVGEVRNYRGFVFARLNEEGISFEDYFGDSLTSLDNMVDRAPDGRLEVAGPPLRYMHKCNWKMLIDNQTDTCHPMVAHESSAGTAVDLFEQVNWPEDEPLPVAMELIAPFTSPYEFSENMGVRTWPNGHGHTGVHVSIHSDYSDIPGYYESLVETHGEEKAQAVLGEARHNTVYFPNTMIKGPIQLLRQFLPFGPDKTIAESWIFRLVGAPDELLARTAMYNRIINAPTSIVGHDDLEMYERAQEGLHSHGSEWLNIQRLNEGPEDFSEIAVENGTSERQMRNQCNAWVDFMTRTMNVAGEEE